MSPLEERIKSAVHDAANQSVRLSWGEAAHIARAVVAVLPKSPPDGWFHFGSHVDCDYLSLEFSDEVGDDGLPLWERPTGPILPTADAIEADAEALTPTVARLMEDYAAGRVREALMDAMEALEAVDPVEWALAGQHAGKDAARIVGEQAWCDAIRAALADENGDTERG